MKFFWDNDNKQEVKESINYSGLSDEELLDSFRSENWGELDEEHRIAVVQEMENRNAVEQGREPATVVSMNNPRYYGSYNSVNNQLNIDVTNVSSYDTLDTYVHETNHAYQQYCVENGKGYDEHTIDMMQAEFARDERGHLYNYASNGPEYDMQCDELDSNNKAAEFMLAQRERYQNDPEYRTYIEERAKHYEDVNSCLDNNKDQRIAMQNNQAYVAYVRGDISEEQYNTLSQNINDDKFVDATVQQSHEIGDSVIELNNEFQQEQESSAQVEEGNSYLGDVYEPETQSNDSANEYMGSAYDASESSTSESGMESDNSMGNE